VGWRKRLAVLGPGEDMAGHIRVEEHSLVEGHILVQGEDNLWPWWCKLQEEGRLCIQQVVVQAG
jgi:hypothetical protein